MEIILKEIIFDAFNKTLERASFSKEGIRCQTAPTLPLFLGIITQDNPISKCLIIDCKSFIRKGMKKILTFFQFKKR